MSSDCIFCKIAAGEMPSYTIYEDEDFRVFLDRFPSSLGHTVIIPKKHIENIYELDDKTAQGIMPMAVKIAGLLQEVLKCSGINLLQNNGKAAGQSVFHYHVHLIPRYEGDDVTVKWKTLDPEAEEFTALLEKIKDIKKL